MAITYISPGATAIGGPVTSLTATYSSAIQRGDLLVAGIRAVSPVTVSDNINGAWVLVQANTVSGNGFVYVLQSSKAAAANTLTITVTCASGTVRITADQFRGAGAFLTGTGTNDAGTNPQTAATTASVGDGNLVFANFISPANSLTFTPGTSNGAAMSAGSTINSATRGSAFNEYLLSSVAGTQTPTCTASTAGTAEGVIVAIFLPVGMPNIQPVYPRGFPTGAPKPGIATLGKGILQGIVAPTIAPSFPLLTQARAPGFPRAAPIPGIALLNKGVLVYTPNPPPPASPTVPPLGTQVRAVGFPLQAPLPGVALLGKGLLIAPKAPTQTLINSTFPKWTTIGNINITVPVTIASTFPKWTQVANVNFSLGTIISQTFIKWTQAATVAIKVPATIAQTFIRWVQTATVGFTVKTTMASTFPKWQSAGVININGGGGSTTKRRAAIYRRLGRRF